MLRSGAKYSLKNNHEWFERSALVTTFRQLFVVIKIVWSKLLSSQVFEEHNLEIL
jgi:hypothetical protein